MQINNYFLNISRNCAAQHIIEYTILSLCFPRQVIETINWKSRTWKKTEMSKVFDAFKNKFP